MADSHRIPCVILGGGGHAAVLIDALAVAGNANPVVVLDAERSSWGGTLLDVPIRGGDEVLPDLLSEGVAAFVVGLGGTGDNSPRQRLFEHAARLGLRPLSVLHPQAIVSRWASVGEGTIILAGAIVNARTRIGRNVIVNTGAIVEHDCSIGDHAHVATGARVAGGVRIGTAAHIGAGAVIRQGVRIGDAALVAAGAVVVKDVLSGETVMGVPAKGVRKPGRSSIAGKVKRRS